MSHKRNLVLKARQFGFTTFYCIDYLDESLWVPGTSSAIIAHEREAADRIFEIVKRAYTYLPESIKPETKTDTKRMLQFTQRYDGLALDSGIYVALKLRGGTVHNLHITESAFNKDRSELNAGSKQTVPLDGRISEETTANGFNEFYDFYMDSHANPNPTGVEYKTYFYPWIENHEYSLPGGLENRTEKEEEIVKIGKEQFNLYVTDGQLLWRRWKIKELAQGQAGIGLSGNQLFMQEYPLTILEAFQSGSGNVFDSVKLESQVPVTPLGLEQCIAELSTMYGDNILQEKIDKLKALHQQGVMFWEMPKPEAKYLGGVDPSDGGGADFGVTDIWSDGEFTQCAQYYGKTRPDELAQITADIGYFFNEAFVGVENNMLSTILFFSKIYSNYYYETRIDEKTQKRTKKLGWNTNTKTRDVVIDDYIIMFDEENITIRSAITLKEMKTFVRKDNGKREHADGKFDDSLFAAFIALQMRKHNKPNVRVFSQNPFS